MSSFLNRFATLFNKEHPAMRKATAITRKYVEPLKEGTVRSTKYRTRRMAPDVRVRLTGRRMLPVGAAAHNAILAKAIASNQANRMDPVRIESVHAKHGDKLSPLMKSTIRSKVLKRRRTRR